MTKMYCKNLQKKILNLKYTEVYYENIIIIHNNRGKFYLTEYNNKDETEYYLKLNGLFSETGNVPPTPLPITQVNPLGWVETMQDLLNKIGGL